MKYAEKNEFCIGGEGGNQNDALGPRVQEHFEFSLYLMNYAEKTNSPHPPPEEKGGGGY